MEPQGLFYYSGISSLLSASFTLGHGVSPSTATLFIPPQARPLPAIGDLVIAYGGGAIRFPDCKVQRCDFEVASSGLVTWSLTLLDHRWRWKFGRISGEYNQRRADKEPRPESIKRPRELAKLLFEAMGETRVDVSDMPDDTFPEKIWEYARADQELAQLCDETGCRVVLGPNNSIAIRRVGNGSPLPIGPDVLDNSSAIVDGDRPDTLRFVGGRTLWEHDFALEAVVEDLDGSIVPLERASYKPAGGWANYDLKHGSNLGDPKATALAKKWAFRAYRIATPFFAGPGEALDDLTRILPITDKRCTTIEVDGEEEAAPAVVFGRFSRNHAAAGNNVEAVTGDLEGRPDELCTTGFVIDMLKGIVEFDEPVHALRWVEGPDRFKRWVREPAELYLRTAVSVRDEETRAWQHFEKDLAVPGPKAGTKPLCLLHDDVVLKHWIEFRRGAQVVRSNRDEVEKQAAHYLRAEVANWVDQSPGSMTYAGFRAIMPDGAISQVSWIVGEDGKARTRASRNRDEPDLAITYEERRWNERVSELFGRAAPEPKGVRR